MRLGIRSRKTGYTFHFEYLFFGVLLSYALYNVANTASTWCFLVNMSAIRQYVDQGVHGKYKLPNIQMVGAQQTVASAVNIFNIVMKSS